MRARGLLLAGSLSFLPFALALASAGQLRFAGATWTGLALGPWLALAGLPRGPGEPHGLRGDLEQGRRAWLLPVALALPSVALGVGLDARDAPGGPGLPFAGLALMGLALVGLWSLAAGAARTPRASAAYGVLWLALVPGAAALLWAVLWAPAATGPGEGWLAGIARGLPLPWLGAAMERDLGAAAPPLPVTLGWLANVGVVLAVGGCVRLLNRSDSSAAREGT